MPGTAQAYVEITRASTYDTKVSLLSGGTTPALPELEEVYFELWEESQEVIEEVEDLLIIAVGKAEHESGQGVSAEAYL